MALAENSGNGVQVANQVGIWELVNGVCNVDLGDGHANREATTVYSMHTCAVQKYGKWARQL